MILLPMDAKKAEIIFSLLQSSKTSDVVCGLREIKKRILQDYRNSEAFRKLGLLQCLVSFIKKPNEEILNGSLSLLSVLITNSATQQEIFDLGGVLPVLTILKCAKCDILLQRACRVLSCLAQHPDCCSLLHKLDAVQIVINLLAEDRSVDTKASIIRSLRFLANTGKHCQSIVSKQGILQVCSHGLISSSQSLVKASIKAISYFARIAHPKCINQLMEGTDHMLLVAKHSISEDLEIYEHVLRSFISLVSGCFDPSRNRKYSFDAKLLDRLCTARAPSLFVAELKKRRVLDIESYFEASTFLARAWVQLMDCGGIALLVQLLSNYQNNESLHPALLRALLGIENNHAFKDKVLKHCLAANLLPLLATQFDEMIKQYKEVRRDPIPDSCIHTIKNLDSKDLHKLDIEEVKSEAKSYLINNSEKCDKGFNADKYEMQRIITDIDTIRVSENCSRYIDTAESPCTSEMSLDGNVSSSSSSVEEQSLYSPPLHTSSCYDNKSIITSSVYSSCSMSPVSSPAISPMTSPSFSPIYMSSDCEDDDNEQKTENRSSDLGNFSPVITEPPDSDDETEMAENENTTSFFSQSSNVPETSTGVKRSVDLDSELNMQDCKKIKTFLVNTSDKNKESYLSVPSAVCINPSNTTNSYVMSCETNYKQINDVKFRIGKKAFRTKKFNLLVKNTFSFMDNELWEDKPEQNKIPCNTTVKTFTYQKKLVSRPLNCGYASFSYSELTKEEYNYLKCLEWLIRLIGQVALVKEAIVTVCREFVPRVMTYLNTAQIVHIAATRMLVTVAKNALSIQPLMDAGFIPFIAVELGEAGDFESPSKCLQCQVLANGAHAFLSDMTRFFGHAHQYGRWEASSRLHPDKAFETRLDCIVALPHILKCPQLLHNFMILHSGLSILLDVLISDRSPEVASFMYASSALSALAVTLQVDFQVKAQSCPLCLQETAEDSHEDNVNADSSSTGKGEETPLQKISEFELDPLSQILDSNFPYEIRATQTDIKEKCCRNCAKAECKWLTDPNKDTTFVFDDGNELLANRDLLAAKNEVLNGMLKGAFSESSSLSITIPGVSKKAFEILVHFIYQCSCSVFHDGSLDVYIELLFISQMYFLPDLEAFVTYKMTSSIDSGNDVLKVYESGVGRIDSDLVLHALCTVLVKPMKTWKRAQWFKQLFSCPYAQDIIHNICSIIQCPLEVNKTVCTCDMSQALYSVNERTYSKLC